MHFLFERYYLHYIVTTYLLFTLIKLNETMDYVPNKVADLKFNNKPVPAAESFSIKFSN